MRHLVAAPDKFRGTATATAAAAAIADGAARAAATCTTCAMSDGGEGFLDVLGGTAQTMTVHGPLGELVTATWSLLDDGSAIVESAQAAGRALLPHPEGDQPLLASTYGVGELLAAAAAAKPTRIVVGCGGTSSTDGGQGCVAALRDLGVAIDVPLLAACDVDVAFRDAAPLFGPQKGASTAQVVTLTARLDEIARAYQEDFGVDVAGVVGAGAAGGLAGGLVALGATTMSGAAFVATHLRLSTLAEGATLLVSGEGSLDEGTLAGKVVHEVLCVAPELPGLLIAGSVDPSVVATLRAGRPGELDAIELSGAEQRRVGTVNAIADAVAGYLGPGV